jgi:hypothetical protein
MRPCLYIQLKDGVNQPSAWEQEGVWRGISRNAMYELLPSGHRLQMLYAADFYWDQRLSLLRASE